MKLPETEQKETESILTPMDDWKIDKVEEILGYKFTDRSLVQDAMTLNSFYYPLKLGKTTARLEFLGDDMINHIITKELYWASPDSTAGEMTRLRSANTDKEKLGRVAIANGLHHLIRHKEPKLDILVRLRFYEFLLYMIVFYFSYNK
jgi:dsRNA-specific ribonuclease